MTTTNERPSKREGQSLSGIIDTVDSDDVTLSVHNPTVSQQSLDAVRAFFAGTSVSVAEPDTGADLPDDVAVLHDGTTFLSSVDLTAVVDLARSPDRVAGTQWLPTGVVDVLTAIEESVTTGFGTHSMIVASRSIEQRARQTGGGRLDVGFQVLSRLDDQLSLYRDLVDAGVDVHVYGHGDWEPPDDLAVTPHRHDVAEIRQHWFVVFAPHHEAGDPSRVDESVAPRALLAVERDPGTYTGFWTETPSVVAEIRRRLHANYPPT